jgi:hypothetical protein
MSFVLALLSDVLSHGRLFLLLQNQAEPSKAKLGSAQQESSTEVIPCSIRKYHPVELHLLE